MVSPRLYHVPPLFWKKKPSTTFSAIKYDFSYPEDKLVELSKAVREVVDDKAKYTDWSQRDDIKAELKVGLILVLAKHGYPPVDRDEVYKEIFEQAENFKRYSA